MKIHTILKFLIEFIIFVASNINSQNVYEHFLQIDDNYVLEWNYTDTNLTARISLSNIVATKLATTWISFGITNKGSLSNSDLIICWIERNQTVLIDSHFSSDGNVIIPDDLQTWQLISSYRYTNFLQIEFTRYILLTV